MRFEVPKKISSIDFGILSPEEIRELGVIRVDKAELYDQEGKGFPGGPLDIRLGAPNNRDRCGTCNLKKYEDGVGCLGHFGYIELASPVYHPGFVKHVEKVLNAVCENCGRLTLPPEVREQYWQRLKPFIKKRGYANWDIVKKVLAAAIKEKRCPYCGFEKQGKFTYSKTEMTFLKVIPVSKDELDRYLEEGEYPKKKGEMVEPIAGRKPKVKKKGNKYYFQIYQSPETIRKILSQIYDEDLAFDEEERKEREKDVYLIGFHPERSLPKWTILKVLPVPPISIRPPVITAEGKRSEDHLTITLRDIVRANEQLRSKIKGGPSTVIDQLWQRLQKLIKALFGLHKIGEIVIDNINVKGIVHRLSGKEGRFRHNLSGKRVNYSGRAVISPDPYLSIDEIGVPEKIARTLLIPEVVNDLNIEFLKKLVVRGPENYPGAVFIHKYEGGVYRKRFLEVIKNPRDRAKIAEELKPGDIVERHLMDGDILVFNRQPTLHRISMMAHRVRVLPYNTLRLHLMTCTPYNADFDGDEMNVHLPRTHETRAEVETLMEVKRHIITARYGGPIIGPKQDFITGAFLLTRESSMLTKDEAMQVLLYGGVETIPENFFENGKVPGRKIFSQFIPEYIYYEGELKPFLCGKKAKKGEESEKEKKKVKTKGKSKKQKTTKKEKEGTEKEKCMVKIWNGEILEGVIDKASIGAEKPKNIVHKIVERWGYDEAKKFLNSISGSILRFLTDRGFSMTIWDIKIPETAKIEVKKTVEEYLKKANELVQQFITGNLEAEPGKTVEDTFEDKLIAILDEARTKAGEIIVSHVPRESQMVIMTATGARGDETNLQQVLGFIGQSVVRGKRVRRGYENRTLSYFKKGDKGPLAGGFITNSFSSGMNPPEYFFHNAGGRDSLVDTAVRTADSGYFYRRLVNALQDTKIDYDGTARMMDGYIVQFKYGGDGIHPGKSYAGTLADYRSIFYELITRRKQEKRRGPKVKGWPEYYDKILETIKQEFSMRIAEEVREVFKSLKNEKKWILSEEEAQEFLNILRKKYIRAQIDPGEPAGTVAAQSISEPATQLTLRTFHWAGVATYSITTGLPRLKEIFDALEVPSTPLIKVFLTPDYSKSETKARKVLEEIQAINITKLIVPDGYSLQPDYNRIYIQLDRRKLAKRELTVEKVIEELEKVGKARIERDKKSKYVLYIYPEDDSVTLSMLSKKIKEKIIKGIKGMERAHLRKTEKGEYYIVIQGKDMSPLLFIDGIDLTRIETNNIHNMAKIFGLEATRRLIMKEAKDVLDNYGLHIDMRHLMFVTDLITHRGKIDSIGRYGISGKKTSVLARAAFEETGKHIFRAAALGMRDELSGATENVIVGGIAPVGTGSVRIGYSITTQETNNSNNKEKTEN